eukprot:3940274-Rhodomonas_salina.1
MACEERAPGSAIPKLVLQRCKVSTCAKLDRKVGTGTAVSYGYAPADASRSLRCFSMAVTCVVSRGMASKHVIQHAVLHCHC